MSRAEWGGGRAFGRLAALACLAAAACGGRERSPSGDAGAPPALVPAETIVRAPREPEPIPSSMVYGTLHIGSGCRDAMLILGDADPRRMPRDSTLRLPVLAGELRVVVDVAAGARWDSTLTVVAGRDYRLGMRPLRCP